MVMGVRGLSWRRNTKMADEIAPHVEVKMIVIKAEGIIEAVASLMGTDT